MQKNIQAEKIFNDINYDNYLVQYQGDIVSEISKIPDYYITIINDRYALVSVKKNVEINMYAQTIKSYLARGEIARSGDIIPNPFWGYGILNVPKIFENMT
ncbi:hypothetical protein GKZ28_16850 [Clostridium chromiireducens]|uniref:Uncharacterized protein n=1 Tax=Clostridium chromiireducens TaxID=225345 RepID=A0A964W3N7_9CLOT|nr:hypothetical protein [Clostridium chromiireducens]